MNYGINKLSTDMQGPSTLSTPIREGGLQMRLTETFKMLTDAHGMLSHLENTLGCGTPPTNDGSKVPGPMSIDALTQQIRDLTAGICERIGRIEQQF